LGLAVLSIMGGAKLALALMVLGIPILDLAVVAINRIRRGQSPLHYDTTHLHYRMKATGLSVKQICLLFYGLTIMFGLLALRLDRIFKFIGLGLVGLTMLGLILWVDQRLRQRGLPIRPGGPPPELTPGGGEKMSTEDMACNGQPDAPDPGNKVHATVTPPLTGS